LRSSNNSYQRFLAFIIIDIHGANITLPKMPKLIKDSILWVTKDWPGFQYPKYDETNKGLRTMWWRWAEIECRGIEARLEFRRAREVKRRRRSLPWNRVKWTRYRRIYETVKVPL